MTLREFLALPDEHSLSAGDVQRLNDALSRARLDDIPSDKRPVVADYLERALLHRTVSPGIQSDLDRLLAELKAGS